MSIKLIKPKNGFVREAAKSFHLLNILTSDICKKLSIAEGIADNHNQTATTEFERAYYVLDGEVTFNDKIKAKKGEVVYIPKGTTYNFKGTFKALIINSPAYRR